MGATTLGELLVKIVGENAGLQRALADSNARIDATAKRWDTIGKAATIAISGPLLALGTASMAGAAQVGAGMREIRRGTGATGLALAALGEDFRAVASSVPGEMQAAATAIADLNTRTGQTGEGLRELAKTELELAHITHEEIKPLVADTTRVFGDWSIATDRQRDALDYLFKVAQSTGIGVSRLSQVIVQYGAPLRQAGFSFEQSAALIGKWEREGVNVETVLAGLKKGVAGFLASGRDTTQVLPAVIAHLSAMHDKTKASAEALRIFGKRGGSDMAAALNEGRFAIDGFMAQLASSPETISRAALETLSFGDQMEMVRKRLSISLAPLGSEIVRAFKEGLPAIDRLIESVSEVVQWFAHLDAGTRRNLVVFGLFATEVAPAILAVSRLTLAFKSFTAIRALAQAATQTGAASDAVAAAAADRLAAAQARVAEAESAAAAANARLAIAEEQAVASTLELEAASTTLGWTTATETAALTGQTTATLALDAAQAEAVTAAEGLAAAQAELAAAQSAAAAAASTAAAGTAAASISLAGLGSALIPGGLILVGIATLGSLLLEAGSNARQSAEDLKKFEDSLYDLADAELAKKKADLFAEVQATQVKIRRLEAAGSSGPQTTSVGEGGSVEVGSSSADAINELKQENSDRLARMVAIDDQVDRNRRVREATARAEKEARERMQQAFAHAGDIGDGGAGKAKDRVNQIRSDREQIAEAQRSALIQARLRVADLSQVRVAGADGETRTLADMLQAADAAAKKLTEVQNSMHNLQREKATVPAGAAELLRILGKQAKDSAVELDATVDRLAEAVGPRGLRASAKRLASATPESTVVHDQQQAPAMLPSPRMLQKWVQHVTEARDALRVASTAGNTSAMHAAKADLDGAVRKLQQARKDFAKSLSAPGVTAADRRAGIAAIDEADSAAGVRPGSDLSGLGRLMETLRAAEGAQETALSAGVKDFGAGLAAQFTPGGLALTAFSGFLQGIQPALDALKEPLKMLGEIVGRALIPVLRPLFPIFRDIGIAGTYLGQIIFTVSGGIEKAVGAVISAIGRLLGHLPLIGGIGHAIERAGKQMTAQGNGFLEGAKQLAEGRHVLETMQFSDALNRATGAANAAAESFLNLPSWYRVQSAIYAAAAPAARAVAASSSSSVQVTFTGDIVLPASTAGDPERQYQAFRQTLLLKARSAGSAALSIANALPA